MFKAEIREFYRFWYARAMGRPFGDNRQRTCPRCKRELPKKSFYTRNDGCLDNICKRCRCRKSQGHLTAAVE